MKLNQKVVISLNVMSALKCKTKYARVEDLAKEVGTTTAFLEQIMRLLRLHSLVSVRKGPGGGYKLNQGKVTAYQVAEAVGHNFVAWHDGTSVSKLNKSINDAFLGVEI